ncbi:MAG: phosphatidylinositol-specific phospholipase C/glycerophosphodiester phosphodiesterase family protein [Candidatus Hydrogenedentota bacterium]
MANRWFDFLPLVLVAVVWAAPVAHADAEDNAPTPLPRAHAHNDYEHDRPLFDALDHGFCSVEVDIFLVDGALLVAHDREDCTPGRTLERLYLDPLQERVKENGGTVYPDGPGFTLLVDIKNTGPETLTALLDALAPYEDMLTRFTGEGIETGAVTVVVSGWFPRDQLIGTLPRLAAADGRLPHLGNDPKDYPLVSENWGKVFQWRGAGVLPPMDAQLLEQIVVRAHQAGQRVRFWNLPPGGRAWPVLYEEGVDLINVDDLEALEAFLLRKMGKQKDNAR